jgi:protein-S-isoprenylcysteine O-methyltransferase Ste14
MNDKKILPPTYLLIAIIVMVILHFLLPLATIIPFPGNFLGLFPFIEGVLLNFLADRTFKKVDTTVKPYEESTTLITTGVFRFSRNPMYLGFVLILIGIAIFLGSLSPYAVVIIFPILTSKIFIRVEEKMLEKTFGKTWLDYKNQVRRWI